MYGNPSPLFRSFGPTLLTLALAGCSATVPTSPQPTAVANAMPVPNGAAWFARRLAHPSTRPASSMRMLPPNVNGSYVTTAQLYGSDVVVYIASNTGALRRGHPPTGTHLTYQQTIFGFNNPAGTVVTPSGTWYIANQGVDDVLVYSLKKSGVVGPIETLTDFGQPVGVDATASSSLVAVSNYAGGGSSGYGSVALYAGGSLSPTSVLTLTGTPYGIGIAIDKGGNCFWSYNEEPSGYGEIVKFPHCSENPHTIIVTGLAFAGGLAFDKAGNLFYTDQLSGSVYKCRKTSHCQALASGFSDPAMINFDAKWKHLWLADTFAAEIYAIDPSSGAILSSTPAEGGASDPPFGVAPGPGAQY
jgi:hypothetical protein